MNSFYLIPLTLSLFLVSCKSTKESSGNVESSTNNVLTQGHIHYSVSMESDSEQMKMALAMMGESSMDIYFNNNKNRTEIDMGGMSKNTIVSNGETGKKLFLIEIPMMNSKKAVVDGKDEDEEIVKTEVKHFDETKTILGYVCKKVVVTSDDGKNFTESTMFVTEEINPKNIKNRYFPNEVNGMALWIKVNSETEMGSVTTTLEATEISKDIPSDDLFKTDIPEGYEKTTLEELKKSGIVK